MKARLIFRPHKSFQFNLKGLKERVFELDSVRRGVYEKPVEDNIYDELIIYLINK